MRSKEGVLTEREREVAERLSLGHSYQSIADGLSSLWTR